MAVAAHQAAALRAQSGQARGARAGKETPLLLASPQTVGLTAGEIGRYGSGAEFATDQRRG